jgi:hypothetical protein
MSAAFTPEQEARVREIAVEVAVAASRAQAQISASREIDRLRLTPAEVGEFLSERGREDV